MFWVTNSADKLSDSCFMVYFSLFEDHCLHHGHRYYSSLSNTLHQTCKTGGSWSQCKRSTRPQATPCYTSWPGAEYVKCTMSLFLSQAKIFHQNINTDTLIVDSRQASHVVKNNMASCTTTSQSCGRWWSDRGLCFYTGSKHIHLYMY